jgi:hypothetical protein
MEGLHVRVGAIASNPRALLATRRDVTHDIPSSHAVVISVGPASARCDGDAVNGKQRRLLSLRHSRNSAAPKLVRAAGQGGRSRAGRAMMQINNRRPESC